MDGVRDQILALGLANLTEFRQFVTKVDELEAAFITPIRDVDRLLWPLSSSVLCAADFGRG